MVPAQSLPYNLWALRHYPSEKPFILDSSPSVRLIAGGSVTRWRERAVRERGLPSSESPSCRRALLLARERLGPRARRGRYPAAPSGLLCPGSPAAFRRRSPREASPGSTRCVPQPLSAARCVDGTSTYRGLHTAPVLEGPKIVVLIGPFVRILHMGFQEVNLSAI